MGLTLVLGGIRSGKSEHAERLARAAGAPVLYVATGAGDDSEMAERIERHRRRRPPGWRTLEAADPLEALGTDLGGAAGATVLVDGLGGWICSLMEAHGLFTDEAVAPWGTEGEAARQRVIAAVATFGEAAAARGGATIVVADEVGLGGVPPGAASRRFLDVSGEATQVLASAAHSVWLVVAGQPVAIKGPAQPFLPEVVAANLRVHGDSQVPAGHLDFAVNVVPGGPQPHIRERLSAALDAVGRYPDDTPATQAVARRHGRPADEVLLLNGAAEAFWLLAHALRPRCAVCVHPSFTEPEAALRAVGAEVVRAQRDPDDFSLPPAAVDTTADFVVTGNPNNPTGTLDPAALLAGLAHPGRVLVVDEAFMDLVPGEPESLAQRRDVPGLVVVRSLTKAWALPGLRAGFLLAPPAIVAALRAARQPWSVNGLALAALEAYGDGALTSANLAQEIAVAREHLAAALRTLPGVRVWDGCANFLLIQVPDGPGARRGLSGQGIAVRDAGTFPGLTPDHLRLAVRTEADNDRLVAALAGLL